MSIEVRRFTGEDAAPYISDLARLRIEVFREFPYLYDGSYDYERNHLQTYLGVADSVVVVAFDDDRVVGVSTGLPMASETDDVKQLFIENGFDLHKIFYFGESMLEKTYRGSGIGVRFFAEREAHAQSRSRFEWTTFCAVQRPEDHARKPADYVALDAFWENRGYAKRPELSTTFSWRDLDEVDRSAKPMVFWIKRCFGSIDS